jgi:hypothetical protein
MKTIEQKWGFGMAPEKPKTVESRQHSIEFFLSFFRSIDFVSSPYLLECISSIKGLFTRIAKQDQWDWFTVFEKLGRPGRVKSRKISDKLGELRSILTGRLEGNLKACIIGLRELGIERFLTNYLGHTESIGGGQIYILSTRENPDFLKIGYTTRSVLDRVKEINSATGVLIPFGVRAVWRVSRADQFEKRLHAEFADYRVRADREFFNVSFKEAFDKVNGLLGQWRIEEL